MARLLLITLLVLVRPAAFTQDEQGRELSTRLRVLHQGPDDEQTLRGAASLRTDLLVARSSATGDAVRAVDSLLCELSVLEATIHRRALRTRQAVAAFEAAIDAVDAHPTLRGRQVELQALLAQQWSTAGRMDSARAVLERAANRALTARDSLGLRRLLHEEMALLIDGGELRGAIRTGERIVAIDRALGDRRDAAYAELGIARAMARVGLTAAFDKARSAHAAFDTLGDAAGAIGAIDLLITTYALTAQEAPLRELIDAGAAKAEARGNPADIARFRDRLGRFHLQRGAAREALAPLEEGLRLAGGAGPHALDPAALGGLAPRRAELLLDLGRAHRALGRMDSALAYLSASEALVRTAGLTGIDAGVEHGEVALATGRTDQALHSGEAALRTARERGDLALLARASLLLYDVHKRRGDTRNALAMHELHLASADSLDRQQFRLGLLKRQIETDMRERMVADSIASAAAIEQERLGAQVARLEAAQARDRMRLLGLVALVLIGSGVLFYRLDRKRRRERFEKEAAHLETQALRSQMNPHFIFNALNSINAFIQRNEPDDASSYLTRFARVMRSVLENSRHPTVPLHDDLETLRGYMDLERRRLQEKFDFTIRVHPDIDPQEVQVPPLVVQPFVENAIWHGVTHMEGKGHITLAVEPRGTQLLWIIEDDGVGRHAPKAQHIEQPAKKTSLGTAITRSRLDLVQKQHGGHAGFRYVDRPTGTRVEVEMPLLRDG